MIFARRARRRLPAPPRLPSHAPGRAWPALGACALALLLAGCGKPSADSAPPAGPPEVGVVTLAPERHVVTTELPGRTSASVSAEIRPQVGAIVQRRLFTEGAQVRAGQVLYQLDASAFEVALSGALAQQARANANLATAENNARRNAELIAIDAISRQQYDDSQSALALARADAASAGAAVEAARIHLGYTRIKSPIAGRTTTSSVTAGALVTANQAQVLTTVSQIDPLYVDVTQTSTEVLRLKAELASGRLQRAGQDEARVAIVLDDGSRYAHAARLAFSGVQVNPATGAITLRATVPNPDGLLMPGMYVRALLEAGVNEEALFAPQQAVTRDPAGNAAVLVVTSEDKVERRRIATGAAVGNRWEVRSGLAAGERVLVDGAQRARPGDTVRPVPWEPKKPAGAPGKPAAKP